MNSISRKRILVSVSVPVKDMAKKYVAKTPKPKRMKNAAQLIPDIK